MTPTAHEKNEWSRLAKDARTQGYTLLARRYAKAAALPDQSTVSDDQFDILQYGYRRWLLSGFHGCIKAI